jgi:hypothetical protein
MTCYVYVLYLFKSMCNALKMIYRLILKNIYIHIIEKYDNIYIYIYIHINNSFFNKRKTYACVYACVHACVRVY